MEPPNRGHHWDTHLSFVERLSSFGGYSVQSMYTRVQMACPLLGGLSSFGVSFNGGFTVGVRQNGQHVRVIIYVLLYLMFDA